MHAKTCLGAPRSHLRHWTLPSSSATPVRCSLLCPASTGPCVCTAATAIPSLSATAPVQAPSDTLPGQCIPAAASKMCVAHSRAADACMMAYIIPFSLSAINAEWQVESCSPFRKRQRFCDAQRLACSAPGMTVNGRLAPVTCKLPRHQPKLLAHMLCSTQRQFSRGTFTQARHHRITGTNVQPSRTLHPAKPAEAPERTSARTS